MEEVPTLTKQHSREMWADLNRCFPYRNTPKDNKAAEELFERMDTNKNGFLTISEL